MLRLFFLGHSKKEHQCNRASTMNFRRVGQRRKRSRKKIVPTAAVCAASTVEDYFQHHETLIKGSCRLVSGQ